MPPTVQLSVFTQLDDEMIRRITMLVEQVTEVDGVRPLSEHVVLQVLSGQSEKFLHVCAQAGQRLVGYAGIDLDSPEAGPMMELAVAPSARDQGVSDTLFERALSETDGRLSIWAHGTHSFAAPSATSRGFVPARELHRMRRSLLTPLPEPQSPQGITIRIFQPGIDDEEWLRLNAAAFVDLPDQGGWTVGDLQLRKSEDWFDPAGFFLAIDDRTGKMTGFHWTKIHKYDQDLRQAVGEIYVIGIDPTTSHRGLGRALSLTGMRYLQSKGLNEVILYVDAKNQAARALYDRLGFTTYNTDVLYRSPLS